MSSWFYQAVLWLARPLVYVRLSWRARREPEYGLRREERFGHVPETVRPQPIWFHTVSAGETIAATPLIKELAASNPEQPFLVTTMTPTGSAQVLERLADQVDHCYAPYDFKPAVRRFFETVQPRVLILMETELWPNLISVAKQAGLKVMIANARLSARSARGYANIRPLMRSLLEEIDIIAAQSEADGQRFVSLGLPPSRLQIMGNIKFDIDVAGEVRSLGKQLRQRMGCQRPVWIAASTHQGEDEIVLAAHRQVLAHHADAVLLLVPRHPERFDDVVALSHQQGFSTGRRSGTIESNQQVIVGDSLGEMMVYYASADIAFVAGSLLPIAGLNVLEPAALAKPIISGPHMHNFLQIEALLHEYDALVTVGDATALAQCICRWIENPTQRQAIADRALRVVEQNRGALQRLLVLLD